MGGANVIVMQMRPTCEALITTLRVCVGAQAPMPNLQQNVYSANQPNMPNMPNLQKFPNMMNQMKAAAMPAAVKTPLPPPSKVRPCSTPTVH